MTYPDYHIHSCFSADSKESLKNIIERAIALGMPSICVTDHHDTNDPDNIFVLDPVFYSQTIEKYREQYADRIDILCGVEVGIDSVLAKEHVTETFLAQGRFDYVIASMHYMEGKDPYFRDTFDCSDEELYQMYFTYLLEALRHTTGITTVGHLDYIIRYGREETNPYTFERYRDLIEALLDEIIRRDLILEINTYSGAGPDAVIHPASFVLQRYREKGGDRIIFGSDAHRAENIGGRFDVAAEIAKEIGFTHLTQVTRDGEKEIPL